MLSAPLIVAAAFLVGRYGRKVQTPATAILFLLGLIGVGIRAGWIFGVLTAGATLAAKFAGDSAWERRRASLYGPGMVAARQVWQVEYVPDPQGGDRRLARQRVDLRVASRHLHVVPAGSEDAMIDLPLAQVLGIRRHHNEWGSVAGYSGTAYAVGSSTRVTLRPDVVSGEANLLFLHFEHEGTRSWLRLAVDGSEENAKRVERLLDSALAHFRSQGDATAGLPTQGPYGELPFRPGGIPN